MADKAPSRSSRGPESEAGDRHRADHSDEWPDVETLVRSLPERFRDPAGRLARELFGAREPIRIARFEDDAAVGAPWHTGLELEEAWAVGQAFRRAMLEAAAGSGEAKTVTAGLAEKNAALDRVLLAAAVATIERSSDAHRRMMQDVSHDLRSPLNSILFLADALRSERSGPLTAAQGHQLDVLYTAAVTLVRMANDLIDFSRLGVGREHITVSAASFSLETIAAEVRSLVGPLAAHRGAELRIVFEAEGPRHGDQRLLSRVLLNLVSNALEAVDRGGIVTLSFADTVNGDLRIEVSDDGRGIDADTLRQLLAITDDRWPGETRGWTRGLGLTISARFVQAAGGKIEVVDGSGQGAALRVDLPFPRL